MQIFRTWEMYAMLTIGNNKINVGMSCERQLISITLQLEDSQNSAKNQLFVHPGKRWRACSCPLMFPNFL